MTEQQQTGDQPEILISRAKIQTLRMYGRVLDAIVTALIFVMLLTLMGALAGLVLDFFSAATAFSDALSSHTLAHGLVDGIDRELVIDVLSVFVSLSCSAPSRTIWSTVAFG